MVRRVEHLMIKSIAVDKDNRLPLVEAHVERLMKSISEIGLLEPIVVCRRATRTPTVVLVAGRHRLEACKRLKHKTIAAVVEQEDSPEVERWRKLAEIDENLIRREITAGQRAKLIARRKAAYEAVYPETKHGATGRGRSKVRQAGHSIDRFTADTANRTGKPERTIRRDATRAKRLGPDLDRVVGTSLDKGSELDALVGPSPEQRAPIIDLAVAGEQVSAVALLAQPPEEPRPGYSNLCTAWKRFRAAWLRACPAARGAFIAEAGDKLVAMRATVEALEKEEAEEPVP
jgi:ParB family transcriptional regulator, chromosome partitioning protein